MTVDTTYYSVQTAAEVLDVDEELVLSHIHSGQIKAINVAKDPKGKRPRWRIPEAELGRFLLGRMHPAGAAPRPAAKVQKRRQPKQYV